MNQTRQVQEEEEPPHSIGIDHFIVSARSASFFVSTRMAAHIEACLDADPGNTWVRFVDLNGSSVRLRRREIEYLLQSTAEQRAADRRYGRALQQERKADRSWEDD